MHAVFWRLRQESHLSRRKPARGRGYFSGEFGAVSSSTPGNLLFVAHCRREERILAEYSRGQLRGLARRLMRELQRDGFGELNELPLRDTFKFRGDLPGISLITTNLSARNHIRSEENSLLFRDPSPTLSELMSQVPAERTKTKKNKGEDFLYSGLLPATIQYLFAAVRQMAERGVVEMKPPLTSSVSPRAEADLHQPVRSTVSENRNVSLSLQFQFEPGDVDQQSPLIYSWAIFDPEGRVRYRYVGKSEPGAQRPLNDYARNVSNLLNGLPYRPQKPDKFRIVHKRMADAVEWSWPIVLNLIRNVHPDENILTVESEYANALAFDDWPSNRRQ